MNPTHFINHVFLGILLSVSSLKCIGQNFEVGVRNKYVQSTPSLVNNGATLLFYADSTYLNFGILKDTESLEMYVWYSYGKCQVNNDIVTCTSAKTFDQKKVIAEIKFCYHLRSDYRLIDNYYEFANENYNNRAFPVKENAVTDAAKNIEYVLKADAATN
jgi:hypothetical protein